MGMREVIKSTRSKRRCRDVRAVASTEGHFAIGSTESTDKENFGRECRESLRTLDFELAGEISFLLLLLLFDMSWGRMFDSRSRGAC